MTENKTKPNKGSVEAFLGSIIDPVRRKECKTIALLMEEITGTVPRMWGDSIVGFGEYHYKYRSGREGEWFLCGFSPRKQNLTLYIMGYLDHHAELLSELGKFKHGKGCLYLRRLDDIDLKVLRTLITTSIRRLKAES